MTKRTNPFSCSGAGRSADGVLVPMELAHLLYCKGCTYEDYVGLRGLKRCGKKKWRRYVMMDIVMALKNALQADYVCWAAVMPRAQAVAERHSPRQQQPCLHRRVSFMGKGFEG